MEGSLNVDNVDNFDKSLLFSISCDGRFTLKLSLVKLSLQIFTLKFSPINLCIVKAGERVVPPKAIHLSVDCPPCLESCLVLFEMADKISMSQRALPEVMSQRYLKSPIYPCPDIPHNKAVCALRSHCIVVG